MKIRPFTINDSKKVSSITIDCLEKVNHKDMTFKELKFGKDYYSNQGILNLSKTLDFYVCEFNGQIIGSIAHNENKLHNFFIAPDFHKLGIGKKMLKFIEELLFKDFDKIILDSSPYAVDFYLKNGYSILKNSHNEFGNFIEMQKLKNSI